tara:strand:- start:14786 stop:15151 length:366 start_codon:yes stop_codon:yes gene_type:complete
MTTETNTLGSTGFGTATSPTNTISITCGPPTLYPNSTSGISSAVNMPSLQQLEVKEVGETIEMIYKETLNSNYTTTVYFNFSPEVRVFKIVYSCVDGKWNKSERIYGEIVPAQEEYYNFDL